MIFLNLRLQNKGKKKSNLCLLHFILTVSQREKVRMRHEREEQVEKEREEKMIKEERKEEKRKKRSMKEKENIWFENKKKKYDLCNLKFLS